MTAEDQLNWNVDNSLDVQEIRLPGIDTLNESVNNRNELSTDYQSDLSYGVSSQSSVDSPLLLPQRTLDGGSDDLLSTSCGSLDVYLSQVLNEQKRKKAKERRLRRMLILKSKRQSGTISFDSSQVRYENKRRR